MLALLTIMVVGFGGPKGAPPSELPESNIRLSRGERVVATTEGVGTISLRLKAGTYTVTATSGGTRCQTRQVKLGHRKQTIKISCVIP
jgi:hypothetical protein